MIPVLCRTFQPQAIPPHNTVQRIHHHRHLPPPSARVEYANIPPEMARSFAPPTRRTPTWIWVVASLLLLTGLLAQSAYFLRDTLVSRFPETRPALEQTCEILGCTFSLPKNLDLLRIVGSDLQTEASGRLKLCR